MNIKYFLLNLIVLNSNEAIHEHMIQGLVRTHSSFFDTTPSGRLTNKFSNDLGILDNMLAFVFTDSIEGPIVSLIMLANVFSINMYFIPLGVLNICFLVAYFLYCKRAIVSAKQLDLQTKSPVFNMVGEMISGLIQIRIYGRRFKLLQEFADKVNDSLRANLCFWMLSRAFGVLVDYFVIVIMIAGWVLGIKLVTPETAGLYGITVVFLIQINDYLQWFLRQLITLESMMVSVERTFQIAELPSEKPLVTDYDKR